MSLYVKVDEAAQMVGVSQSTIKKYYLMVEDNGYRFERNNQGQLMFSNQDIEMFRTIVRLKSEPGYSVQSAVQAVVSSVTGIAVQEDKPEPSAQTSDTSKDMKVIMTYMERQDKINEVLLNELKATKEYIAEKLDAREETLLLTLQESQEQVKKLVEEKSDEEEKWKKLVTGKVMDSPTEKKKWWQIFS